MELTTLANISQQLAKTCENINSLAQAAFPSTGDLKDVYEEILLDEVQHAQLLVIEMTKAVTHDDAANSDSESVFAPGELSYVKESEDEE